MQTIVFLSLSILWGHPFFCYPGFMNENQRRVILYGNSLILEGVRSSLDDLPGLEVLLLSQPLDHPVEEIRKLSPAAVIFDLEVDQPNLLLQLIQQPGPLLIGIDPETHQALVWSVKHAAAVAADNLIDLIQHECQNVRHAGQ
jgi:hypothetical protein